VIVGLHPWRKMPALDKISFYQNRRDDVPNQELARQLAQTRDLAGIAEIAANLANKNKNIRSDCLKVLYETGYLEPSLIAPYVADFLRLLSSRDNRLIWGAMIALGTLADLRPDEIWASIETVISTVERGSVITVLWGVRVLAKTAAANPLYSARIFPFLTGVLETCIPRDVPTHAESMLPAVNPGNLAEFTAVLLQRQPELSPAQLSRLKKVRKQIEQINSTSNF
jgi:hypothetical protein